MSQPRPDKNQQPDGPLPLLAAPSSWMSHGDLAAMVRDQTLRAKIAAWSGDIEDGFVDWARRAVLCVAQPLLDIGLWSHRRGVMSAETLHADAIEASHRQSEAREVRDAALRALSVAPAPLGFGRFFGITFIVLVTTALIWFAHAEVMLDTLAAGLKKPLLTDLGIFSNEQAVAEARRMVISLSGLLAVVPMLFALFGLFGVRMNTLWKLVLLGFELFVPVSLLAFRYVVGDDLLSQRTAIGLTLLDLVATLVAWLAVVQLSRAGNAIGDELGRRRQARQHARAAEAAHVDATRVADEAHERVDAAALAIKVHEENQGRTHEAAEAAVAAVRLAYRLAVMELQADESFDVGTALAGARSRPIDNTNKAA